MDNGDDRVNKNRKLSRRKGKLLSYQYLVEELDFVIHGLKHFVNLKESFLLSSSTVKFEKKLDEKVQELIKQQNNE